MFMEQLCCFSFLVSPVNMEHHMACSAWFLKASLFEETNLT